MAVRSAPTIGERGRWILATGRQRLLQTLPSRLWKATKVAEYSSGRVLPMIARAASAVRADLYIGHYAEGLAAAGIVAARTGAMLGFDAEDFHTGEANSAEEIARTDFIQARYLPRCRWVTTASSRISEAVAERYKIALPLTVNNVFPFSDRAAMDRLRRDRRRDDLLSVYWYSQAIGLDRGIQDVIRAAGELGGKIEIHLRGSLDNHVRQVLQGLAQECGVHESLYFHDPVPPDELLSRAAEHDVGLALEQPRIMNRALCTTNKLFMYFLAGLAVVGTAVPGQIGVLQADPDASAWYPPGNAPALALILERWRADRAALVRAKAAALESARTRWNWEKESKLLVEYARDVFGSRAPVRRPIASKEEVA